MSRLFERLRYFYRCCFFSCVAANNLVGSIPSEIGYYGNLIDLDLSNNTIDGSIAALVNLTRLEKLNCSMNALTGTLPEFLFTHRSLTDIDLQDNRFFGLIGESLGKSDQLQVFWLRNN
jgi:Leucine-rich repeat (LRR) protein